MAYLTEVAEWIESIYQLETDDLVLGGPDGIDNVQARELACRTLFLKLKKADIDSPKFTGEPTAPTPSSADDGSRIATVEYVSNANKSTVFSFNEIPIAKSSDVIYVKGIGIMEWRQFGTWAGYATLDIGQYIPDTDPDVRTMTIDAVGDTYLKAELPGLWAWAQAKGKVVSAANWKSKIYSFVDLGTSFRVPDMRDVFIRATGTDADNANVRTLGSFQSDGIREQNWITRSLGIDGNVSTLKTDRDLYYDFGSHTPRNTAHTGITTVGDKAETRPANTALAPRIIAF